MNSINSNDKDRDVLRVDTPDVIVAGISDVGSLRSINEDHIWIHDSGKVLLLADGMGGHDRGADASRIALETLHDLLLSEKNNIKAGDDITIPEDVPSEILPVYSLIRSAVKETAAVMVKKNSEWNLSKYMGTTVAGVLLTEEHVLWFHIGDSRVYRYRRGRMECLTVDHSLYAEWEKAGSPGKAPARHLITRVLGNNPKVVPDINFNERKKGDIYLLCSDGLSDMVSDEEIEKILKMRKNIHGKAEMLVNEALSAGGKDNVSVILAKIL